MWIRDVLVWALICVAVLLFIWFRRRRALNRIKNQRANWSPEEFWEYIEDPGLPNHYSAILLKKLQERVQSDFPVMPRDHLSFYDVGTYVSVMEGEFVQEFCQAVNIPPPTVDEVTAIQSRVGSLETVNHLIKALGILLSLRKT